MQALFERLRAFGVNVAIDATQPDEIEIRLTKGTMELKDTQPGCHMPNELPGLLRSFSNQRETAEDFEQRRALYREQVAASYKVTLELDSSDAIGLAEILEDRLIMAINEREKERIARPNYSSIEYSERVAKGAAFERHIEAVRELYERVTGSTEPARRIAERAAKIRPANFGRY